MKKLTLDTRFFMCSTLSCIIGEPADAISDCYTCMLWNLQDGNILLNFKENAILIKGDDHNPKLIRAIKRMALDWDMSLYTTDDDERCTCPDCMSLIKMN